LIASQLRLGTRAAHFCAVGIVAGDARDESAAADRHYFRDFEPTQR